MIRTGMARGGFTTPNSGQGVGRLGETTTDDFMTWLAGQSVGTQVDFAVNQAVHPSSMVGGQSEWPVTPPATSWFSSIPTWAIMTGFGLLGMVILIPPGGRR